MKRFLGMLCLFVLLQPLACGRDKKGANKDAVAIEVLYTGKEAKRKILLYFPSLDKPGLISASAEIYQTASALNQAKQVLRLLLSGPLPKGAARPLEDGALREVFLDGEGLAVLDLRREALQNHPGGTTAEYATIASLFRSLTANFKEVSRMRVLVDGALVESLIGHFDLSGSLSMKDF